MSEELSTGDIQAEGGGTVNVARGDIHQNIYNINQAVGGIYFDLPNYVLPLGRDSELKEFYNRWQAGARHLLFYGSRGMGKACVAKALAYKVWESAEKQPFQAGLWWSAAYQRSFEEFFDYLKGALSNLSNINPKHLSSVEGVYTILRQHPVLLVVTKIRRTRHQKLLDFLQGIPGSATVILTATTPVAGWSSLRLQKLDLNAALGMLKEKARNEGCEYILSAPEDKLKQLCELCDGSPVALSMVINVFLGENPDIDLVLENVSMGKDVFRILCAIAYDELSELAKTTFRLVCLSRESYAAQALQEILGLSKEALKDALSELVDAGLVFNTPEMDFEERRITKKWLARPTAR
jgi:hypothetical protein